MNTMDRLRSVAPGYNRYKQTIEVNNVTLGIDQQRLAERRIKNITVGVGIFVAFCIGSILLMSV